MWGYLIDNEPEIILELKNISIEEKLENLINLDAFKD